MKTRLLKRLRKQAKKDVFLCILGDGEFAVRSKIGWYSKSMIEYHHFSKRFGNAVRYHQLHDAKKILDDARRLYMWKQLMELKRKKYKKYLRNSKTPTIMTREAQIRQKAADWLRYNHPRCTQDMLVEAFRCGAQWADENPINKL